jgi:hypothetical protein
MRFDADSVNAGIQLMAVRQLPDLLKDVLLPSIIDGRYSVIFRPLVVIGTTMNGDKEKIAVGRGAGIKSQVWLGKRKE